MVVRIAGGDDRETDGEFCRMMEPRIRLFHLRHLRISQSADDLVQQVLITAHIDLTLLVKTSGGRWRTTHLLFARGVFVAA